MGRPKAQLDPDLRRQVWDHLAQHPGLTSFTIARALRLEDPYGRGRDRIRRELEAMRDEKRVVFEVGWASETDRRAVTRWWVS